MNLGYEMDNGTLVVKCFENNKEKCFKWNDLEHFGIAFHIGTHYMLGIPTKHIAYPISSYIYIYM